MYLAETPDQQALRKELREYFAAMLTPEVRAELGESGEGKPLFRELVRRMGADGWLGLGWPKEFGGQGRPATDQFIMFDEIQRAHAPFPFVTVNTVGPAIMAHGTQAQKDQYLTGILKGEINFAIGYTEPEAGTDLASLRTTAVLDGDEWVINGNKVYTSGANQSDYVWLACRTDPDAPKHQGISIIIVPTNSKGFEWTPIVTVGGVVTTATYYTDVRVPKENVIGQINGGWKLITMQLNHERVGLAALSGLTERLLDDVTTWCRVTPSGGADDEKMIDVAWVQQDLAKCHALLDAIRLMTWKLAQSVADNTLGPAEASAVKVFGTERAVEVYRIMQGILGPMSHLRDGSDGAVIHGEVERAARAAQINTFGGGVNEIQRELVATAGLGLVRSTR
ncbi:MAG: acyl-CoA dehydrogenase [Acidimicrobiia bacterium]|nr:acyl-CoA dehydrogenase [Actinomycetota bacterium]NDB04729.1 acyl-CoA dehydrogenase [Acidimicrobiia bacterium]NDD97060.1 acyl-CoA dehydrogenase [Actinomycetota bacterium]NDE58193.1 acyl-CoA dehydrogenase [Acidimicrobiia bacterium]NDE80649.1 acyl-CoA dehydrogenase [Actinomycetota bacterium]